MNLKASIAATLLGLVAGAGCSSSPPSKPAAGDVETSQTTAKTMTFAECQESAKYGENGGQYAVEYDNGVCTVQKP